MKIQINIYNRHHRNVDLESIKTFATRIWENESKLNGQINIILESDKFIKKLNYKFLNIKAPTDVIAFPLNDHQNNIFEGEIYVSLDRVAENSEFYKVEFSEELHRMVAHGLLHFVGYEDKSKYGKQIMHEKENGYLNNLSPQK